MVKEPNFTIDLAPLEVFKSSITSKIATERKLIASIKWMQKIKGD